MERIFQQLFHLFPFSLINMVTQCENHGTGRCPKASPNCYYLVSTAYTHTNPLCYMQKTDYFFCWGVICRKQASKEELLLIHKLYYKQKKRLQEELQSHFQIYHFFLSNGSNPNLCPPQWKPFGILTWIPSTLTSPPHGPAQLPTSYNF